VLGAMGAAVHKTAGFNPMADNPAAAVLAFGSEGVNGAFEAIEVMRNAVDQNLKRLVVFVAANLANLEASVQGIFGLSGEIGF